MTASSLPVDIWLIVFEYIDAEYTVLDDIDADSLSILWCIIRNVSSYLHECIDEYFRRGIIQNTLIDLSYSNIHHHSGPAFAPIHIPMRFSHLAPDGIRAVFRQMCYKGYSSRHVDRGSVRGWVPFAERHYAEMCRPKPQVVHRGKAKGIAGPPAWKQEHSYLRNTLAGEDKTNYLAALRDHTSIGRGYRPPYYLKSREAVNNTELVDLAIDCEAREISFDWRRTFALFFVEQRFIMLADRYLGKQRVHDADPVAAAGRAKATIHMHDYWNSSSSRRRARRKRLQPWTNNNKHRMTPENRSKVEDRVEGTKHQVRCSLLKDNLRELALADFTREAEEIVPEECAEDLPYLLQWPWGHANVYEAPRKPVQIRCGSGGCSAM